MDETIRLRELKEFLRSRRSALRPEDVGLTPSGRRRAGGLRREELASLAGVSVSWYTWLEQGRPIRFSAFALARVARALRLSATDEAYFFELAGASKLGRGAQSGAVAVSVHLQAALQAIEAAPALVFDHIWDVLAFNQMADQIFEFDAVEGPLASNHLWRLFRDPVRRALYEDWWQAANWIVGNLRSRYAALEGQPRFESIFNDLKANCAEFASMWETGHTTPLDEVPLSLRHRCFGPFKVVAVRFSPLPHSGRVMSLLTPADPRAVALFQQLARRAALSKNTTA